MNSYADPYPLERFKCLCGPRDVVPPITLVLGMCIQCPDCGAEWAVRAVQSQGHEGKPEVFMDLVNAPSR